MSPDMTLKVVYVAVIAGCLLVPPLLVFFLLRWIKAPAWATWGGAALVLAIATYVVFFRMLPDTFRGSRGPRATIEVVVPDQFRGFLYLFFDSQQAPLRLSHPNVYTLFVPASGRLRAGQIPGPPMSGDSVNFAIRYLNGEPVALAEGSRTGGSQSKDGWSVVYLRPFIGSTAEFEAEKAARMANNTFFDELEVLEQMRQEAKSPKKTLPASLEGINAPPR